MARSGVVVANLAFITVQLYASSLHGSVQSPIGSPLPNAMVILRSPAPNGETARSETDQSGLYSFPQVRPGIFTLEIQAKGFASAHVVDVQVSEGEDKSIPGLTLQLGHCGPHAATQYLRLAKQPYGTPTVSGIILDQRNRAVAGTRVELLCQNHHSCAKTVTDGNGTYVFSQEPGEYSIHTKHSGFFDELYDNYLAQSGFETVYYPIHLERCAPGKCQPWRKPVGHCD